MGMRECCGHVGLHRTVETMEEKSEALFEYKEALESELQSVDRKIKKMEKG